MKRSLPLAWVWNLALALLVYVAASIYAPKGMALLVYYGMLMAAYCFALLIAGQISAPALREVIRQVSGTKRPMTS